MKKARLTMKQLDERLRLIEAFLFNSLDPTGSGGSVGTLAQVLESKLSDTSAELRELSHRVQRIEKEGAPGLFSRLEEIEAILDGLKASIGKSSESVKRPTFG